MDRRHQESIVPVTAISVVQMVSGPPVQRAVPEEYVLTDLIIRAMEARDGRELEFVLKAYLPFLALPTGSSGKCFLLDLLGLTSTSIRSLEDTDLEGLIEKVRVSETSSQVLTVLEEITVVAHAIVGAGEVLLRGVVSGSTASGVAQLLTWPLKEQAEAYSLLFPSAIDESYCSLVHKTVKKLVEFTSRAKERLPELADALRLKVRQTSTNVESDHAQTVDRLDLRIAALRKEIATLESRIKQLSKSERRGPKEVEARELLKARESALERDNQRRDQILSEIETRSRDLGMKMDVFESNLADVQQVISDCQKSIETIEVSASAIDLPEDGVRLFVPVLIVGLSRKGRLDTVVYPPSVLIKEAQKVGLRRDFIDSLSAASDELAQVARLCEEQVSNDVSMKKTIRDSSEVRNVLALKNTRVMIREGSKLLLADGLVKESILSQIESLLLGFPERTFTLAATPPAGAEMIPGKAADSMVSFHVRDELGASVGHAVFETADLRVEGNEQGVIKVRLWSGSHKGRITAPRHRDKPIEFSLQSAANVIIPVVLSPLSREEGIDRALDQLVERAERIDQVRKRLWDAFEAHGETLLSIPAYRSTLTELLSELGYDPEPWISEAKKKKGMVKRFLKRDDRVDALRRDILRIAEDSKQAGGIMLLSALLVRLDGMGWTTDIDEVSSILDGLSRDELIEGLAVIEGGARLVKFVPVGLTDDPQKILSLAAEKDGRLTTEDAVVGLGWTEERVRNALELLVSNGVAKVQKSYSQSTQYWFPGLRAPVQGPE